MKKTNAMRLLDTADIKYEVMQYSYDEKDLSGVSAAAVLGMDAALVFKTLVLTGDKSGVIVAIIPVAEEINLKTLARVSGNKKVEMLHQKHLLATTGYMRGGCSPVGMKKIFPAYIEESALLHERIGVNGGQRGMQVVLSAAELIDYLGIKIFANA